MLCTPFGLTVAAPASPLLTPSVMSVKPMIMNMPGSDQWTELTFSLTGTTGNLIVLICSGTWTGQANGIASVTWAGDAVTEISQATEPTGTGGALVWAGYIKDGWTDGDLYVLPVTQEYSDFIGYVISLDRMAASPIGNFAVDTVKIEQERFDLSVTALNSASRLLAAGTALRAGAHPCTSNFSILSTNATGGIAALLGTKVAGTTDPQTFQTTAKPGFGTNDWGAICVEVVPA